MTHHRVAFYCNTIELPAASERASEWALGNDGALVNLINSSCNPSHPRPHQPPVSQELTTAE